MRHQHRQYAILTSYDFTWFLYRNTAENYLDGFETLYISRGIPINKTDNAHPSILQCFGFFSSIISSDFMQSPPPSTRTSPRGSVADRASGSSTPQRTLGSARNTNAPSSIPGSNTDQPIKSNSDIVEGNFQVDDFKLKSILGIGRAKVCYEENFGIALKFADVMKSPGMLKELRNEVRIYKILSDLQGKCIPQVVLFGHWDGLYCVGVSFCGKIVGSLNMSQKQKLIDILDCVHRHGVIHGDIRRENILVDALGNPFLIDFRFGTENNSLEEQKAEMKQLLKCIDAIDDQ